MEKEAQLLKQCCTAAIEEGIVTSDLGGNYSTSQVGDYIASKVTGAAF